jgi:putative membrane protein
MQRCGVGDATLDEGMTSVLQSLTTLPSYLLFEAVMLGFLLLFILAYTAVTPYRDLALVRQGNTTAALTLGGAMIGFALPLTSVASHTTSIVDLAVWGVIALVSQLLVYVIGSRVLLPDFRAGVEADRTAYGVLLGSLSIAVGLLNYGSLTY